jgi:hypothetical protein
LIDELAQMNQHLLRMRDGRKLEVIEYGDRTGHPAFFFHGLIGSHHPMRPAGTACGFSLRIARASVVPSSSRERQRSNRSRTWKTSQVRSSSISSV